MQPQHQNQNEQIAPESNVSQPNNLNVTQATHVPKVLKVPSLALTLVLAILFPPLGLILSIWVLVVAIKSKRKGLASGAGLTVGIIGTAIAFILIGGLVAIYTIFYQAGGGGHPNQAQDAMKPIQLKLV